MKLYDSTNIPLLNKALDVYALRQKISASNMANITTNGYKSQSVSFEEQLAQASQPLVSGAETDAKHMAVGGTTNKADVRPRVVENADEPYEGYNAMASGFNDVDIDHEMAALAQNQIQFKFGSRILGDMFKGMQKAIRGTL